MVLNFLKWVHSFKALTVKIRSLKKAFRFCYDFEVCSAIILNCTCWTSTKNFLGDKLKIKIAYDWFWAHLQVSKTILKFCSFFIDSPWAAFCYDIDLHHNIFLKRVSASIFKGTVSQDFLLLVFFLNQFPPSLWL